MGQAETRPRLAKQKLLLLGEVFGDTAEDTASMLLTGLRRFGLWSLTRRVPRDWGWSLHNLAERVLDGDIARIRRLRLVLCLCRACTSLLVLCLSAGGGNRRRLTSSWLLTSGCLALAARQRLVALADLSFRAKLWLLLVDLGVSI